MCSGGGGSMPKPITREEMEAATDNRFENPNSGVSAPSWKPDKVKTEKAEIAAEETAATTDTAEITPRSSSSGSNYTYKKNAAGKMTKMKKSTYRKSLRTKK